MLEIERKFLVKTERWREGVTGIRYRQGYLDTTRGYRVSVRSSPLAEIVITAIVAEEEMRISIEPTVAAELRQCLGIPPAEEYSGELSTLLKHTIRFRLAGDEGILTIKLPTASTIAKEEFEFPLPVAMVESILENWCGRSIDKYRYRRREGDLCWEIDEFFGDNAGLIVAEVELSDVSQTIELPDWVGMEVSDDPRYYNSQLVDRPYSRW
jgi:adenylate cyclase